MSYVIKNTFYDNVEKVSLCGLNDEYLKLYNNNVLSAEQLDKIKLLSLSV